MDSSSDADSLKDYELEELYARPLHVGGSADHHAAAPAAHQMKARHATLGPEFQHRAAMLRLALEEQQHKPSSSEEEPTTTTAQTEASPGEEDEDTHTHPDEELGEEEPSSSGSSAGVSELAASADEKPPPKHKHPDKGKEKDKDKEDKKKKQKKKKKKRFGKDVTKDLKIEFHTKDLHELADELGTDLEEGLSNEKAKATLSRQGANVVVVHDRLKWIKKFLTWFFGGFGIILWPAALLCIIAYQPLGGDQADPANLGLAIVLLVVAFLSGIFNAWQDWKSMRVINTLAKSLPRTALVFRQGSQKEVPLSDIVPGDVAVLTTGTRIPADVRLIEVQGLKVDNSILTGESEPISCTTEKTDDNYMETKNLAFMGTNIVEGSGLGLVVATGNKTVMGKLSMMTHRAGSASTPITKEINWFMVFIASMAIITAVAILLAWGLWLKPNYPDFLSASQIVVTVIGTMIAFLPDGLPLCINLTLTLIAQRMQEVNVMVKSLPTVETLGSIDVIASDKTGTLTQNKMSVMHYLLEGTEVYDFNSEKDLRKYQTSELFQMVVKVCALCNQANFDESTQNLPVQQRTVMGNASDVALLQFAEEIINTTNFRTSHHKVAEIPFNSRNKWMLSVWEEIEFYNQRQRQLQHHNHHRNNSQHTDTSDVGTETNSRDNETDSSDEGSSMLTVAEGDEEKESSNPVCVMMKGAPEYLLDHCSSVLLEDGTERDLDEKLRKEIAAHQESFSSKGERVLGMCFKNMRRHEVASIDSKGLDGGFPIEDLCFVGLITLIDPPKEGVADAIEDCHEAGITVVMVTGDHPSTATAIARMTGLVKNEKVVTINNDEDMDEHMGAHKKHNKHEMRQMAQHQALVVCGVDLAGFSKRTWDRIAMHKEIVFARTTPEHKLRIVKEFQKRKHVVAVTGDGVNDSPALKQANVGVAMGSGSEVAKEAADLILMDSRFESMVKGIFYGRIVFENLRKVLLYLLPAGSFSELMPILANVFLGMPLPLSSFLMIVICAATDVLPSLSLIYENAESRLMEKTPRSVTKEKLVNIQLLCHAYFFIGLMESITAFGMYFYYMSAYGGIDIGSLFLCFDNYTEGFFGKTQHELDETLYTAQSIFFVTLVVLQVTGNLLSTRTRRNSFFQQLPFRGKSKNPRLFIFGALSIALAVQVVYLPIFNDIFNTRPIPEQFWFIPIGVGLIIFCMDELRKIITRQLPFRVARWICW